MSALQQNIQMSVCDYNVDDCSFFKSSYIHHLSALHYQLQTKVHLVTSENKADIF